MNKHIWDLLAWVGVIILVLWALIWSFIPPMFTVDAAQKWTKELTARAADPAWRAEQTRLHKKHGLDRVIIYTPQDTYYLNERGQKCPFM